MYLVDASSIPPSTAWAFSVDAYIYAPRHSRRREGNVRNLFAFLATSKAASKEAQKASSAANSSAVREHKEMCSQMVFYLMTVPFFSSC
ncbi:hypothetical protein CDAR_490361 [Caerostris darwini]|uniref:Uncharacterized protein n=1 Tax=Caerostris darwini TaxID=1538125 RepID=A0AAV4R213_9ARAC|nr:hypothetical protein CDAR_490361 [Caerostris darwini]